MDAFFFLRLHQSFVGAPPFLFPFTGAVLCLGPNQFFCSFAAPLTDAPERPPRTLFFISSEVRDQVSRFFPDFSGGLCSFLVFFRRQSAARRLVFFPPSSPTPWSLWTDRRLCWPFPKSPPGRGGGRPCFFLAPPWTIGLAPLPLRDLFPRFPLLFLGSLRRLLLFFLFSFLGDPSLSPKLYGASRFSALAFLPSQPFSFFTRSSGTAKQSPLHDRRNLPFFSPFRPAGLFVCPSPQHSKGCPRLELTGSDWGQRSFAFPISLVSSPAS